MPSHRESKCGRQAPRMSQKNTRNKTKNISRLAKKDSPSPVLQAILAAESVYPGDQGGSRGVPSSQWTNTPLSPTPHPAFFLCTFLFSIQLDRTKAGDGAGA